MSAGNVDLVKGIYAAFARGDVPAVVAAMSPDIVWNEAQQLVDTLAAARATGAA